MTWRKKKLDSAGDTIVEVLIVLAVVGAAIGISYATASKGLSQSQNAQEHAYALGLLNSQVEMLRSAVVAWSNSTGPTAINPFGTGGSNVGFCLASPTIATALSNGYNPVSDTPANTQFGNYPAACQDASNGGATYYKSIVYNNTNSANTYFDFIVRWQGLGGAGVQQEELSYKINPISLANSSTINISSTAPAITVVVHEIPLTGPAGTTANPTPSCSNPVGSGGIDGINIKLTSPYGSSVSGTTSAGQVTFQNLTGNATYNATITGMPSGYQLCNTANGTNVSVPASGLNVGSTTATPNTSNRIDANNVHIAAQPVCTPRTVTPASYTQWDPNINPQWVLISITANYSWVLTSQTPNYSYYWNYIGTWYTGSNKTYIGVYAKYSNTTAGPSTLGWVAWADPYYVGGGEWAWPMYQVDDYVSSYTNNYTWEITSYTYNYGWVNQGGYVTVYPPSYVVYDCPS